MTETNNETGVSGFEIKIKNISWDAKQEDVEKFLQSFASVEQVKLLVNTKTNRSKGYAYATLKDQVSLDKALSHTQLELMGRTVQIVQAKPKGEKPYDEQDQYNQNSVYVGNLNKDTTEEELQELFTSCGQVRGVKLVVARNDENKVYGFVDFQDSNSYEAALKLDGQQVAGQIIVVSQKRQQNNRQQQGNRNNRPNNNYRRDQDNQDRRYDNNRPQRRQYDRDNQREYRGPRDEQRNERRNDGQRQERRNDGQRYEGQRNEGQRYEGQRNEGQRYEGQRYERRNEGQRNEGQRNQRNEENSVYVGNLNFNTEEQTLEQVFSQIGIVDQVRIVKDRETGRSKGFAFVNFTNSQDAKNALDLNEEEVDGRTIRVDLQSSKQKTNNNDRPRNNYGRNEENNGENRGQQRTRGQRD